MATTEKLVLAFVTLIVGIVLLSSVATQTNSVTDLMSISSDPETISSAFLSATNVNTSVTFTITNPPVGWEQQDCKISNFVLKNSSGTALTATTDYVFDSATGTFTLANSTAVKAIYATDNVTNASYDYCGEGYMNLTWGRTTINIVPGLFAIAMLGVSIALFYSIAKENGIFN